MSFTSVQPLLDGEDWGDTWSAELTLRCLRWDGRVAPPLASGGVRVLFGLGQPSGAGGVRTLSRGGFFCLRLGRLGGFGRIRLVGGWASAKWRICRGAFWRLCLTCRVALPASSPDLPIPFALGRPSGPGRRGSSPISGSVCKLKGRRSGFVWTSRGACCGWSAPAFVGGSTALALRCVLAWLPSRAAFPAAFVARR